MGIQYTGILRVNEFFGLLYKPPSEMIFGYDAAVTVTSIITVTDLDDRTREKEKQRSTKKL